MPAQQNIWLWNHTTGAWVQAPACVTSKYMAAAGQVAAGARRLYWLTMNPSAALSAVELSDDLTGLTATVWDHFDTTRDGHMMNLYPPMYFANGIYLKTFTNMTSITFGFI